MNVDRLTDRIRLDGKVAIVTGASSGIGREGARIMSHRGARLVAVDQNAELLHRLAEILPTGARWIAMAADMTDERMIIDCVARACSEFGRIDILFNAFGADAAEKPIHEIRCDDFQRTFAANAMSIFLSMKHVIPVMVEGGGGVIVNRSGVAAWRPGAGQAAPAAASAAVVGMTRTAALEWGEAGIRANCINPGPSVTDKDAALLAAFLASDEASFITGAVYPVEGVAP